jgi:hypothetical protein
VQQLPLPSYLPIDLHERKPLAGPLPVSTSLASASSSHSHLGPLCLHVPHMMLGSYKEALMEALAAATKAVPQVGG